MRKPIVILAGVLFLNGTAGAGYWEAKAKFISPVKKKKNPAWFKDF
jgi:hypothetical protein